MIFYRPYAPEGKGKLERWHRTFRNQFLSELDSSRIHDLNDLNTRLWAWIEQVYHRRVHTSYLQEQFQWLLESPGIGLLTGEPGVGKTAALQQITAKLNPHRYQVIYTAETDFGRLDIYRSLAGRAPHAGAYAGSSAVCHVEQPYPRTPATTTDH